MSDAASEERLVNAEHEVQFHLVREIRKAIRERRDVAELVSRLKAWCEAHFSSEELLMGRHAYPYAAVHAAEHRQLGAALAGPVDETTIERISDSIRKHIREHDSLLHDYLHNMRQGA